MPFVKGQVLTHKRTGRPKGFKGVAKMIAKETRDGAELVEYALKVFRSKKSFPHQKWEALCWLADRSIGKPVEMVALDAAISATAPAAAPKMDLGRLNADERAKLRDVLLRALARPVDAGETTTGQTLRLIVGDAARAEEEPAADEEVDEDSE